jgi:hypothetical protein
MLAVGACTDSDAITEPARAPVPVRPNLAAASEVAVQVAVSDGEACVLKGDYNIVCWTRSNSPPIILAGAPFIAVTATPDFISGNRCVVRADLSASCLEGGDRPGPFVQVGTFSGGGCGVLVGGTLSCWGAPTTFPGNLDAPSGTFTAVDGTCALRTDATVECWGANGGVGLDTEPSGTFSKVSAGHMLNCALRTTGTLHCWGDDRVPAPPAGTFIDVEAGEMQACAITPGLELRCWGYADPDFPPVPPPPGQFLQVAVGDKFSCAINASYKVVCWGPRDVSEHTPDDIAGPRPTTTTVASTPNPSGFGASATFTATVRIGSTTRAATAGTVTFIEGGTCAAPTTTLASAVAVDQSGRASFSTSTLALGAHTITGCYGGAAGYYASEGSATHTVDPAITTTVVAATPTSRQYSDRVTLAATITPSSVNGSTPTGTVQFKIGGANVGSPVTLGSDAKATLPNAQVTTAAGSHTVEAVITSTHTSFKNSTGSTTLTVTREDAEVVYNVANATALEVSTPGGSLDANALSLSIGVKENEPDAAVSPGTTGVGSVANAGLAVQLVPVGPGTTYTLTCTPGTVSGTGYQATRPFTCTNPASIAVNVYEVQVSVTGDYYTGTYDDAFTVFDRSLGFVSGGGTFILDGDRVRFGINTKYKKNGDAVKGSAIVVRTHADGTRSTLTSNALTAMAIGEDPTVPMGWAALNGKATYTWWDAKTRSYMTTGGQSFTLYTEDRGTPGNGVDRVWVGGPPLVSLPGTQATAKSNAATLTGGNVVVPHRAK